jgi:hypothetical protein
VVLQLHWNCPSSEFRLAAVWIFSCMVSCMGYNQHIHSYITKHLYSVTLLEVEL